MQSLEDQPFHLQETLWRHWANNLEFLLSPQDLITQGMDIKSCIGMVVPDDTHYLGSGLIFCVYRPV